MLVTITNGYFTNKSAHFIGAFDAHHASVVVDGNHAILPAHWLEFPKACHTFNSPTKTIRLPAHLEGQLRAIAKVLEQQIPAAVTEEKTASKAVQEGGLKDYKRKPVTRVKKARKRSARKRSRSVEKVAV